MCIFGRYSTNPRSRLRLSRGSVVQVTATKLAWTLARTPAYFLLFSGEICRALITES
jgi:hypothetical protein